MRDKLFLRNYEHRPSATEVVLRHFDNIGANSTEINAGIVKGTVSLSTNRCFPGQEIGLELDLHLASGWHIYGSPLPANYQSLDLTLESSIHDEQSLEFPAPRLLSVEALGETLPVYSAEVKVRGKVGIKWSPPVPAPFLKPLGKKIEPGLYEIQGMPRFQACNDELCVPPQTIRFALPLIVEAGIPGAQKKT